MLLCYSCLLLCYSATAASCYATLLQLPAATLLSHGCLLLCCAVTVACCSLTVVWCSVLIACYYAALLWLPAAILLLVHLSAATLLGYSCLLLHCSEALSFVAGQLRLQGDSAIHLKSVCKHVPALQLPSEASHNCCIRIHGCCAMC